MQITLKSNETTQKSEVCKEQFRKDIHCDKKSVHELLYGFRQRVTEIEDVKKQSVASKKALAEKTRAFMKQEPEEALNSFNDLLRAYQIEVEALSKRCRSSETAFIEMTNVLSAIPSIPMGASDGNIEEVVSLRSELKDLEEELSKLKNQDVTVRQQASRIKELEAQKLNNLSAVETENARKRDEIEMAYSTKLQRLQADLEQVNGKTKSLESEIANLNHLRVEEKYAASKLVLSKQEEVNQLMQQVEALEVRVSVGDSSNPGTLELYKDMLLRNEERIRSLEETLLNERKEYELRTAELMEKIDSNRSQHASLEAEKWALQNLIDSVKSVADQAFGMRPDCDLAQALKEGTDNVQQDTEILKARINELQTERNRLVQEAQSKDERIDDLERNRMMIPTNSEALAVTHTPTGSDDVVTIIQAQRDRFRTRVLELEAERDTLKQGHFDMSNKMKAILAEKKKIESENIFWKSQNSSENKPKSPGDVEMGGFGQGQAPPTLASVKRRITVAQNGGVHELEHSVTSLIVWGLGNPLTRRAALLYLVTLHLLVFLVLYRISSIVSSAR